ncbi:IucA/IucC family protein [Crenobacter cavernae]|uniref:Siderophore synthetase n=1 Tax=Crenobacter cavernae TaxID=2290923 RepID=A0ABY0FI23_9NEIS|nr:IucA/IucC family protein [Crenobacter cavernae]RXZ44957.1 siderophore synthetase [Crenobacter cavernae]
MTAALPKLQQAFARWGEALETPAFQKRQTSVTDLAHAVPLARERSFQRLIQALFREGLLDTAQLVPDGEGRRWLALPQSGKMLRFDALKPGAMRSWQSKGRVWLCTPGVEPREMCYPSELLAALSELFQPAPQALDLLRLAEELDDSLDNDVLCLAYHHSWNQALEQDIAREGAAGLLHWLRAGFGGVNPTALLEQWGTLGHPWHPNHKTKLGLSPQEVIALSPEFESRLPVQLAALHRRCAHLESLEDAEDFAAWWQEVFPEAARRFAQALQAQGLDPAGYLPLPVHPWQLQQHLPQAFAAEIASQDLVLTGVTAFTAAPTMSFRTVAHPDSRSAPMVKLPVSLRLTSVQRTVSPRSARMGPRVSHLLRSILKREPQLGQVLAVLPERYGVHYAPQPADDERSRHLAVLFRDNPLGTLAEGEMAIPVGSLFAPDGEGQPLLRQWVRLAEGADDTVAMRRFFRRYCARALQGLLAMYLVYGVGFEAHQQNSFAIMGRDGRMDRLLIRDFGDIRIHRATLQAHGLSLELHDPEMTLVDDAAFVRDKLLHCVFMCHLGELALLCARHWSVAERLLWDDMAERVAAEFDALKDRVEPQRWQSERQALLEDDWPAKSFVRMRLADSHADVVGRLPNPLRPGHHAG